MTYCDHSFCLGEPIDCLVNVQIVSFLILFPDLLDSTLTWDLHLISVNEWTHAKIIFFNNVNWILLNVTAIVNRFATVICLRLQIFNCHQSDTTLVACLCSISPTVSHIEGNKTSFYAQWFCKWISAALQRSYCAGKNLSSFMAFSFMFVILTVMFFYDYHFSTMY